MKNCNLQNGVIKVGTEILLESPNQIRNLLSVSGICLKLANSVGRHIASKPKSREFSHELVDV